MASPGSLSRSRVTGPNGIRPRAFKAEPKLTTGIGVQA